MPHLVSVSNDDSGQLAVYYNGIIPYNTAAIQERDSKVKSLEAENAILSAEIAELKAAIEEIQRDK